MLARIEAEITTATNRVIRCEKWRITHDVQKVEEARSERETKQATIEELHEQVKQLTSRLEQGELQLKSLDGICTFRAADLRNQFLELQERRNSQSLMTIPASTTPEPIPTELSDITIRTP